MFSRVKVRLTCRGFPGNVPGKKGAQLTPIPPRLGQGLQMRSSTFSGKGSHELAVRAPTNLRPCHEMRRGSTCTVWTCWQHISNTLATHLVDLYCVDLVGKLYFFTCWQAFLAYRYLPHHTHTPYIECVLLLAGKRFSRTARQKRPST